MTQETDFNSVREAWKWYLVARQRFEDLCQSHRKEEEDLKNKEHPTPAWRDYIQARQSEMSHEQNRSFNHSMELKASAEIIERDFLPKSLTDAQLELSQTSSQLDNARSALARAVQVNVDRPENIRQAFAEWETAQQLFNQARAAYKNERRSWYEQFGLPENF